MSVCRWSSDDHRSDLYVYLSAEGWTIHVTSARLDADWSKVPPPIDPPTAGASASELKAWSEAYMARRGAVSEILREAPSVPIDHPTAGGSFVFPQGEEAADFIDKLERDGLHVPEGVADAVRFWLETEGDHDG